MMADQEDGHVGPSVGERKDVLCTGTWADMNFFIAFNVISRCIVKSWNIVLVTGVAVARAKWRFQFQYHFRQGIIK